MATTDGISGDIMRDMMADAIKYRFGFVDQLPHDIEWLNDNSSAYTASETRCFAKTVVLTVRQPLSWVPHPRGWLNPLSKHSRDYLHGTEII